MNICGMNSFNPHDSDSDRADSSAVWEFGKLTWHLTYNRTEIDLATIVSLCRGPKIGQVVDLRVGFLTRLSLYFSELSDVEKRVVHRQSLFLSPIRLLLIKDNI